MNNKNANRQLHFCLKPACAAILLAFAMQTAQANPIGASVVNGQASFAATGNTLTVTNTPGTIINWQGFSIGANEITRFAQQSASSAVLNRVISNNPSNILGTLQSNGRVFLINPNGIVFGAGATIDVAGMVASTLNLSNTDFLAGRNHFTQVPGAANISNAGNLTAQTGGQIYLIAPNVENTGVITAPNGEILLVAGHSVDLVNTNDPNLRVSITAPAGDATNVGQLIASSGSLGLFGTVVRNSGQVSADGATMQGGKIVFKASQRVEAGGTISAQGAGGGEIKLLADMQSGTVNVTGTLDASSIAPASPVGAQFIAPFSGIETNQGAMNRAPTNGGFIETSAAHVNIADTAHITTAAPSGKAGTWLLDPYDFTIAATGGDITGAALSTALGAGAVTIQTVSPLCTGATCGTGNLAGNGDIFVNDAVSWSVNTLTLTAERDININAVMTASGTSVLALNPSYGGAVKMGFNPAGSFLGRVDFPGRSGAGILTIGGFGYTIINSLGAAGSTTGIDLQGMNGNRTGFYALGSNINAAVTSTWNGVLGFDPVGTGPTSLFQTFIGRFDGLGHTITGLTINRPTQDYIGLFGLGNGARISNVGLNGGSVIGRDFVGGLVGFTNSGGSDKIANSYFTGTITGFSTGNGSVGGLVGANYGSITNSYSTANVNGVVLVGGLVGWNRVTGAISSSYSTGAVIGGVSSSSIGGLVGYNNGYITNSYSTGSVSGIDYVGGLAGNNWSSTITNSYSTGSVNGSTYVGGLVGYASGTITSSYWDKQTSGKNNCAGSGSSAGCTGRITIDMMAQANFTGWDFTTIWRMYEGHTYPLLKSFLTPLTVTANAASKTYDGAPYSGGNGVTYSIASPSLLGTLAYSGTSQGAVNAGSYLITPGGYYSTGQNGYDIGYVNGVLTISSPAAPTAPAPVATAANTTSFLPDLINTMLIPGGGASGSSQSTIGTGNKKTPPPAVVAVNGEILPADSDAQPLPVCPQ